MTKNEIINLIQAKDVINKYRQLLSTINETDEKYWFPNIPDLKEQFEILKKELIQAKKETLECENIIKNIKCSCEVRLRHHFIFSDNNKCVLCGNNISSDNVINFRQSNYRNKHTVTFDARYQENDDGPYEVKSGKTEDEVKSMILEILKQYNNDDEVDLVEDFSKLGLENMEINTEKRKQEKYILIIGGTNIHYIDAERCLYLAKNIELNSFDFFKYFSELLNTKIAVIDRKEILDNKNFREIQKNCRKTVLYAYTTLDYLDTALFQVQDIDFKLIIDLSEFYDYEIRNDKIIKSIHSLNLKEKFSNSYIVKIQSINDFQEVNENAGYDMLIGYKGNEYYYIENGKLEKCNFEKTCGYVKKMIYR